MHFRVFFKVNVGYRMGIFLYFFFGGGGGGGV